MNSLGFRETPTPPGVPVMITSPGSSVIVVLNNAIKFATLKIRNIRSPVAQRKWFVRARSISWAPRP
jgi:hypothetical protein